MHAPVYAAVVVPIKVIKALNYRQGFLRSCPVVEVNKGFAVNPFLKDWEIFPDFIYVKTHKGIL